MDYTKEIIALVKNEKQNYEDASQDIRSAIKKARKYYDGKFDSDTDESGAKKYFVPMTRWECDILTSKIYVNDKAITVLPENEKSLKSSFIADKVLKYQINQTRFPTTFRNSMYDLSRDGTTVWALYWDFEREVVKPKGLSEKVKSLMGKGTKPKVNVLRDSIGFNQIDVLNTYIDPTADSIQQAPSFIYKNVTTLDNVKRNKLYNNTEKVKGFKTSKSDTWDATSTRQYDIGKETIEYQHPMVNVFERWGKIPLNFLTGKKKDEGKMIDGVITIADMEDGVPTVLRVSENPFSHGYKPFEECWYQKIKNRWYGIGVGEKLTDMQAYINKSFNRQNKNADILHAGLFKKKRGSGISARSVVSVPGGIIEVDNMDDLQQLDIRDVSQLSTPAIQQALGFSEMITGANDIAVGSAADRSATTSLIKDRNSDTRFAAVRGNINDFLIRFFKQWIALDRQYLDKKFIVRVTGDDTALEEIDGILGVPPEVAAKEKFRFIDVSPSDIKADYDLEVDIDQSIPMNKAENAQRILQYIQVLGQLGMQQAPYSELANAYAESIGLRGEKYKIRSGSQPLSTQPEQDPNVPVDEMAQFQEANVPTTNIPNL
jgi:hypothetical protein